MPVSIKQWQAAPSLKEVLLFVIFSGILFTMTILLLVPNFFTFVDKGFGDNGAYMKAAAAIRHWQFAGLGIKHFWGFPYLMAAVSELTGASDRTSLLLISACASLVSVGLAYRLWGGWVAGFFAALNFDWIQRSFLGGSEPLFTALLFSSFLAVRHDRWLLATFLASLSTVVRPLGFLALVGIGLTLLRRREFRTLSLAVLIGAVIGGLYALPLSLYFGDPLATVHSYTNTGSDRWLFGLPFYAIIKGTIIYPPPITNLVLSFGWIFFVSVGSLMMVWQKSFRKYSQEHPVEVIFAALYLLAIFSYNLPFWARMSFARFAIPVIPFVLLALKEWIPKDRRLMWGIGLISSGLAAVSAVGLRNTLLLLQNAI
jgi:hypothetical protein